MQAEHTYKTSDLSPSSAPVPPGMVEVRVQKASEVDHALNEAIVRVRKAATRYRLGIMVTRLEAGWYIVRAHPEVPFGLFRAEGNSVLLHCVRAESLTPTVAALYVARVAGISAMGALADLRRVLPGARPNPLFLEVPSDAGWQ